MEYRNVIHNIRFKGEDGIAAMEFAIMLPFLVFMALGSAELTRNIIINQKADKIAFTVADIVAQSSSQNLTSANMTDIMNAAAEIMKPFTFGSNGIVIVTSVYQDDTGVPRIKWQSSGGGALTGKVSKVGTIVGSTATFPSGFTVNNRDNIIVTEVYYTFAPITNFIIKSSSVVYKAAYFKPRLGMLTTAPS